SSDLAPAGERKKGRQVQDLPPLGTTAISDRDGRHGLFGSRAGGRLVPGRGVDGTVPIGGSGNKSGAFSVVGTGATTGVVAGATMGVTAAGTVMGAVTVTGLTAGTVGAGAAPTLSGCVVGLSLTMYS